MSPDLKSMNIEELTKWILDCNEKGFRAKQLFWWMHKALAENTQDMKNLPAPLRQKIDEAGLVVIKKAEVRTSKDGTRKYLFALPDGNIIESVLMRYHFGNSVCISTQVGCRMGCRFCASTLDGLVRNLSASEMLEQVYQIQKDVGERVSHVVLMGSGEPLDNLENVLRFINLISCSDGQNISQRNLTISTCGIVPGIEKLIQMKPQVTLALSLHAPDDEVRKKLMPIANRYKLDEVLSACRKYFYTTGRRITFEYSLVAGVNDNEDEARKLAGLLEGFPCHVNLIPVNPIKERDYVQSDRVHIENFKKSLEKKGIHVTIRREMGRDIDGACGQLRKSFLEERKS